MTETFIAAVYTPPGARSPNLRAAVATSDELISELETATEYVFGVPMYNLSVPAGFKAYIDQIVIPGHTFTIDESGCKRGLLYGKKATVITSSGWLYRAGSPPAAYNHQEPWIRTFFAFIGVTSVDFVIADGLAEIEHGGRDQYLRAIRAEVQRKAGQRSAIARTRLAARPPGQLSEQNYILPVGHSLESNLILKGKNAFNGRFKEHYEAGSHEE